VNETRGIKKWHKYWIETAKIMQVPVLFFRFEDLLVHPKKHLNDVFRFIF
jgi:hypothetical protein